MTPRLCANETASHTFTRIWSRSASLSVSSLANPDFSSMSSSVSPCTSRMQRNRPMRGSLPNS
jgi:hypothetical protein